MQNIQKIVDFVTVANWLIMFVCGLAAVMTAKQEFALGVILGGLIVAVNFHLLKNTLKKAFDPEVVLSRGRFVVFNSMVKYYLRFAVNAAIIYLLLSKQIVNPFGLIIGLSVVVASILAATLFELTRSLFREAV